MCVLTIGEPVGIGPGPTSIRVSGTVEDCTALPDGERVFVDIFCGDSSDPIAKDVVANVVSGIWEVVVNVPVDSDCKCGGKVTITARCATDDSCTPPPKTVDVLRCPECPEVSFIGLEPGEIDCNPDGTASVPLRAFIVNNTPTPVIAIIEFGTNPNGVLDSNSPNPSVGVSPGTTEIVEAICRYPTPSDPKPFIRFTDFNGNNLGCPDILLPLDPLGACDCPRVVDLTAEVEGCFVRFEGMLQPPIEGCIFHWVFGDGAETTTSIPEAEHTYQAADTYAVAVTVECDTCGNVETTTVVAEVTDCTPLGACCFPDGSCEELTEAECLERGGDYQGDGSDCGACTGPPPDCGKPTLAIAIAQAILLSGLVILNLLRFCLMVEIPTWLYWVLTVVGAAPLITYVIYEFLCWAGVIEPECCFNNCDRYLMAWVPLVSAGIVAMYVAGCCGGWWWALVIGLIGLGLFFFWRWVKTCDPDHCEIAAMWVLVFVTGVPTAFLIIKTLTDWTKWIDPTEQMKLKECPYEWVEIIVAIVGIVLGIIVAKCAYNSEESPDLGELEP